MGDNRHEVSLGSPTLATFGDPEVVEGANAGIVLPRWSFNGAWRFQARRNLDIGIVFDWGLDRGSRALAEDQPDPDNGDVRGGGLSLGYSFEASPVVNIGLAADLMLYSIPYVEYETCVDPICLEPFTTVDRDRDTIPVVSIGIIPSFKLSRNLAAFAGANLRNHPTIRKGDIEMGIDLDDEEVEAGPGNIVASAGLELALSNGLRAMAYVFQPVYMDPVEYGPTVGVAITIPLYRESSRPATVPYAPPPPAPYAPPPPAPYPAPPPAAGPPGR